MVPSVQGFAVDQAVEALCGAGLNVEISQSVDPGLDARSLVGESAPRAGSESPSGATVVLQVLSKGAGAVSVTPPDGCTAEVVEVIGQPGGTYGSGAAAP